MLQWLQFFIRILCGTNLGDPFALPFLLIVYQPQNHRNHNISRKTWMGVWRIVDAVVFGTSTHLPIYPSHHTITTQTHYHYPGNFKEPTDPNHTEVIIILIPVSQQASHTAF
jgi:hypothetical protein